MTEFIGEIKNILEMESHGKIPWYFIIYPDRGMIKKDSTTAIDRSFLYIGIINRRKPEGKSRTVRRSTDGLTDEVIRK